MSHGGVMSVDLCGFCCEYWCRCWSWTRILVLLLSAKGCFVYGKLAFLCDCSIRFNPVQITTPMTIVWMYVWYVCCWGSSLRYRHHTWVKRRKPRQNSAGQPTPPKHPAKTLENEGKLLNNQRKRQKLDLAIVVETRQKSKIKDWCSTECPNPPTGSL